MPIDDRGEASPTPGLREITDVQTMRALAHPVRIALIETLTLEGPLTATEVGELIGESATTCSFHLRQLAKYQLVEEAGGGKGRARPWRMSSIGMTLASHHDDPATQVASSALVRLFMDRTLARYRAWTETRSSFPREWQEAADQSEFLLYVTPEELREVSREIVALLLPRSQERLSDPSTRPPGAAPVEVLLFAYPLRLPGSPT